MLALNRKDSLRRDRLGFDGAEARVAARIPAAVRTAEGEPQPRAVRAVFRLSRAAPPQASTLNHMPGS